jgi:hypothetical protein
MVQANKPSFPDYLLFAGETAQYALHASRLDRLRPVKAAIGQLVGSECEAYEQQLWLPPWKIKHVDVTAVVITPSVYNSPRLAKNWTPSSVIGINEEALEALKAANPQAVEAAAYRSERAWHVGIQAVAGARIFESLDESHKAFAARQGGGYAEFTAGVYSEKRKLFTSVRPGFLELVETYLPDTELPQKYPGIKLI